MRILSLFLLCLLATACRGQWIATHQYESFQESQRVRCYTLGFCRSCTFFHHHGYYSYGYDYCWYGPHNKCPGTRDILVEVTPEDGYFINYPDVTVKRDRVTFVKELTPCKVDPRYRLELEEGQTRERVFDLDLDLDFYPHALPEIPHTQK